MIAASDFLTICKGYGIDFFSGTPCSYLKPLINEVIDDPEIDYYGAANEGDALAMVCGASLLERKGVVMFQNSGLGNAVNPITSLSFPFRFPCLMIVTHRGQPGGPPDEPQHELMGQITEEMLSTMRIKWEVFPQDLEALKTSMTGAIAYMEEKSMPFAYVLRKGTINPQDLKKTKDETPLGNRKIIFEESLQNSYSQRATRTEALETIIRHNGVNGFIVATTGKTGRELYTLNDCANNLYMVGSMGCASSFTLGAALCSKDKQWTVLDGDAATLMRMGNLATIGACQPPNFLHIVLDNEVNDSTGGQDTVSSNVSLAAVASSCGYKSVYSMDRIRELDAVLTNLKKNEGPVFIHFRIKRGSPKELGRPKIKPFEVKERMMLHLRKE